MLRRLLSGLNRLNSYFGTDQIFGASNDRRKEESTQLCLSVLVHELGHLFAPLNVFHTGKKMKTSVSMSLTRETMDQTSPSIPITLFLLGYSSSGGFLSRLVAFYMGKCGHVRKFVEDMPFEMSVI